MRLTQDQEIQAALAFDAIAISMLKLGLDLEQIVDEFCHHTDRVMQEIEDGELTAEM